MSDIVVVELIKGVFLTISALIALLGGFLKAKNYMKNKKEQKRNLFDHPIFSRIELNKTIILTHFSLENVGKELVFKEILISHLDIYDKNIKDLCEKINAFREKESDSKSNSHNEISRLSINCINKILTELSNFYESGKYTEQEKKVFKIVAQKYNRWNKTRDNDIILLVDSISSSVFYPNTYTKTVAILDVLMFSINDTIVDAEKTLNNINGDLKGLKFKGEVI